VNHQRSIQITAAHPANTPWNIDNIWTLGAALGRWRDDTSKPVGIGGRAQSDTPAARSTDS